MSDVRDCAAETAAIEKRVAEMEKNAAVFYTELHGVNESLKEIKEHINKPTNWAEWITASLGVGGVLGAFVWAVFVQPIEIQTTIHEARLDHIETQLDRNKELFGEVINGFNLEFERLRSGNKQPAD